MEDFPRGEFTVERKIFERGFQDKFYEGRE